MKKIIIIGATSGIGKEIACIYARQGHTVAVTGRRHELLAALQQQFPKQIITASFDVREGRSAQYIQDLIELLGGLDLFIYNSGVGQASQLLDIDIEKKTTETNVNGFIDCVVPVFNYFMQQGTGQIALTSSIAALRGNAIAPAYSASKAFMSTYAEGLSLKAYKSGKQVSITDIRPGFVDTAMAQGNDRFWVMPLNKVARQIVYAVERKKRIAYITRRWGLVAQIFRLLPFGIYKRLG